MLEVLLIYPHSPLGAQCLWDHVYISQTLAAVLQYTYNIWNTNTQENTNMFLLTCNWLDNPLAQAIVSSMVIKKACTPLMATYWATLGM